MCSRANPSKDLAATILQSERLPAIASGKRASFFKAYWRALHEWRRRERARAELSGFSDRELMDIGVTRSEIDYITSNGPIGPRAAGEVLTAPTR